jgi:hypothetical protein
VQPEGLGNLINSVFVFSLRVAFDCEFNLKTLKVHNMFQSLRPSSGVKIVDQGSCCSRFFRVHKNDSPHWVSNPRPSGL